MNNAMYEIINIMSASVMQNILSSDTLSLAQYSTLTGILLNNAIPFDTTYNPGTRRDSSELTVTIYVNPKTTIEFSFSDFNLTDS